MLLSLTRTAYLEVLAADEAAVKLLEEKAAEWFTVEEQFEDEGARNAAEDDLYEKQCDTVAPL